ncbi:hypothetical protein E2320_007928 [Naja naja]|nr:hypothetical protein E2320_007928 [Naja naja]
MHETIFSSEKLPSDISSTEVMVKSGYQDPLYLSAAHIFQSVRNEKPHDKILVKYGTGPLPSLPDFKDEEFQRLSYELASRRFGIHVDRQRRLPIAIHSDFKTKLAAALARCRIKHDALTIEHILPETIRRQEQRASTLPLYAWVNTLKVSLEEVHSFLQKEGFTKVQSISNFDGDTYCLDKHYIELLHEDFTNIEPTFSKLQKVKVILLLPRCSGLGVSNPIEFILKEHEDAELLRDLSQGSVAEDKLSTLAQQQLKELTHAMQFAKVQALVYCTCSLYPEENEVVVNKALASGAEGAKAQPYKLCPPVLPLCSKLERDPSESVSVKDVLARAAAKGLLDGIDLAKPSKREEKKKKKHRAAPSKNPIKEVVMQSRIQEFLEREMKSGTMETASPGSKVPSSSSQVMNQASEPVTLKKVIIPLSNSSLPVMAKNNLTATSTMQKVLEKQRNAGKARNDDRVMILKPVEIVLPPVMMPYFNPQGNRAQISTNHCYYRWIGGKHGALSPSSSKRLIKSKEPSSSTATKHSRPWL